VIGRLLIRWAVLAIAIGATAALLPGIHIDGGIGTVLWIALLFGLVNGILGTVLRVLTFPLAFLTLGLFTIVVTAAMFSLTAGISTKLDIDNFWWSLLAAGCIGVIGAVLDFVADAVRGD
jgi:putative membrane protein